MATAPAAPRRFQIIDARTGLVIDERIGTKSQVRKHVAKSLKLGTWQLKAI
jgi:hypothetical protein